MGRPRRLTPGTHGPDLRENPKVLQGQLSCYLWASSRQRQGGQEEVQLEEQQRGAQATEGWPLLPGLEKGRQGRCLGCPSHCKLAEGFPPCYDGIFFFRMRSRLSVQNILIKDTNLGVVLLPSPSSQPQTTPQSMMLEAPLSAFSSLLQIPLTFSSFKDEVLSSTSTCLWPGLAT